MQRRLFIRLASGSAVAATGLASASLAGCGSALPPEAIEAWAGPAASVLQDPDPRRWLLSHAMLAPHSHNLQSWVADLATPGEIILHCDLKRLLPQTDPLFRQIMMSHGTFLELLDIAARERGLAAQIDLFPQGEFAASQLDKRPVARVRLTADTTVAKDPLFAQIPLRHTNRNAYGASRAVPQAAWRAMAQAARQPGLTFGFAGLEQGAALAQHRSIANDAWRIELTTPRTIMESYDVLRVGAAEIAKHRDGLSLMSPIPVAMAALGLFDRSRPPAPDAYATTSQISDFAEKMQSTPGFLWLVSEGNSRAAQVNAGRAYVRAQLAATAHGLAMQPLSQALQEYAEQKAPYAAIHKLLGANSVNGANGVSGVSGVSGANGSLAAGQTVQMWARVGYAAAVPPAPRRRLQDFIQV
jgi:hypothetical protein